ncbi:MAG: glycoside hydrolase family 95 protein [Bacteroidetes bacterium]|nr:glycoside hydrolase family 95 protein [Bacteroidota bacterium]
MKVALKICVLVCCPLILFAQKKQIKKKTTSTSINSVSAPSIQAPLKLWYANPAQYFEEALVLGNGRQGATVFGGIATDKIYLNDLTLWSGEPVNANMNPQAYKNLPGVRKALQEKNYKKAGELIKKIQGKFSESYAPLGTLYLELNDDPYITDYYRELDLDNAIAKVKTTSNNNVIEREYLVSNPDKIFAIHLTSKKVGALGFTVYFQSLLQHITSNTNNTIQINGIAPVKADPSYVQKTRNAVMFDSKRGTRFTANLQIQSATGEITKTDSSLSLAGATEATIYVSMATSFNGYDKDPATKGLNNITLAETQMNHAKQTGWTEIKKQHIKDYQNYFKRVELKLSDKDLVNLPTDERLKRYAKGELDPYLETLYFQYGRYLLIASSRTPGVPANLQGLWNPYIQPPWSSNYTININAEENYWLAENTNLSEMHLPFLQFIGNLSTTGKITAKTFYNMPGWVAHHNSDIWAMSNPVGNFGNGDPVWANWAMGGTWASTHLWEHYLYTQDQNFLEKNAYLIMRGAAEFCLAWLVPDSSGQLITSPSTSPENTFKMPSGFVGSTFFGGTADLAMIRELFIDILAAQKVLKNDNEFAGKINTALNNLHGYQVGKAGNLQEWYYDWEDSEPKHRHQSHLYGLFPGNHVTVDKTPSIAAAAKKTLEIKGDETTGWSKGWRINLWARLKDGDHAYKMYRELLKYVPPDETKENYTNSGGTYPNLLDAHPPFQIDGNFGGAAAVAEMLVQSNSEYIELLPALPKAWPSGAVKGLKTRGNFEIEMSWNAGQVTQLKIKSSTQANAKVLMNGKMQIIKTSK